MAMRAKVLLRMSLYVCQQRQQRRLRTSTSIFICFVCDCVDDDDDDDNADESSTTSSGTSGTSDITQWRKDRDRMRRIIIVVIVVMLGPLLVCVDAWALCLLSARKKDRRNADYRRRRWPQLPMEVRKSMPYTAHTQIRSNQ